MPVMAMILFLKYKTGLIFATIIIVTATISDNCTREATFWLRG